MNNKPLIVDTDTSNSTPGNDRDSETAMSALKAAESKLQSELDVVCNYLELLDAVSEGEFHWTDGATTVDAVKQAPPSPQKGRQGNSEGAK